MEAQELKNKKKRNGGEWKNRISFSASLPDDAHEAFSDSICAVMYSTDPVSDIRASILEMIHDVGVQDWSEMEELIYCYIVLNSLEVHGFIAEAFLSLCSTSSTT
nr:Ovate protein family [Ipomoea batatas]